LAKRLTQHNAGRVRYTKGRMPWKMHYAEAFPTRSEAVEREHYFKNVDGYTYLKANKVI